MTKAELITKFEKISRQIIDVVDADAENRLLDERDALLKLLSREDNSVEAAYALMAR